MGKTRSINFFIHLLYCNLQSTQDVAKMGRIIEYWWEIQKERDHQEYLDVGRRMILKFYYCLFNCNWVVARWQ
jgi:hypothetical protein